MPITLKSVEVRMVFMTFLYCILIVFVSRSKAQTIGPNGGILEKTQNYFIEVKIPGKFIYAYLLDKKLNAINNKEKSCNVKFYLPDSTGFSLKLKLLTDGGFMGENSNGFNDCLVTFAAFGQSISARFKNASIFVIEKS